MFNCNCATLYNVAYRLPKKAAGVEIQQISVVFEILSATVWWVVYGLFLPWVQYKTNEKTKDKFLASNGHSNTN